jgi:hypothetical protein
MEVINLAWAVYKTDGTVAAGPQDANSFFGENPSVFTADPRCYYDVPTHRWFLTILATDLGTGNSFSRVDIAVSKTSDPAGPYYLYRVDDTFSGQGGCPCFGDQPLLGADANGFYVSVNAFTFTVKGSYKGVDLRDVQACPGERHHAGGGANQAAAVHRARCLLGLHQAAPAGVPFGDGVQPGHEQPVTTRSGAITSH